MHKFSNNYNLVYDKSKVNVDDSIIELIDQVLSSRDYKDKNIFITNIQITENDSYLSKYKCIVSFMIDAQVNKYYILSFDYNEIIFNHSDNYYPIFGTADIAPIELDNICIIDSATFDGDQIHLKLTNGEIINIPANQLIDDYFDSSDPESVEILLSKLDQ